jgi:hypothetical protein
VSEKPVGIAAYSAQGAKASAAARRKARLDVDALLPLDSAQNAQRRLALISDWGVRGLLSASMVGAQERVHREWRESHAFELDLHRLKALEQRVRELEAELAGRPGLRQVRS